jgi:prepilin-type N-terminal cleavage/methylation domain-containing protein
MSHSYRSTAGFTLVELMVVIAIIGILASIMFPVFSSAREKARQTQCLNNQKQLALAIIMYAHDFERFPGTEWEGALDIPGVKSLLVCPNVDDRQETTGYGMNAYLHGLKQDVVSRPQLVVATCDSLTTSTVSADHKRHRGFAIYSRVDGSAHIEKIPENGGRFAAGKFPLTPTILVGDLQVDVPPESFVDYAANTPIAREFRFVGPYGSDDDTLAVATPAGLLEFDYIGEDEISRLLADDIPLIGETAPRVEEIMLRDDDPSGAKLVKNWQIPELGAWTPSSGPAQECVRLELEGNFNTQYPKRTAYAMLFVYSEQTQSATIKYMMDDMGIIWMNGREVGRDTLASDLNAEVATNQKQIVLPKGISYILFRSTNWTAGGAKFNVIFDVPVKVGGSI